MWGCSGVVVNTLDFRSEGLWFDAQSLPSCHLLINGYCNVLLGVTLQWTSIPPRGE